MVATAVAGRVMALEVVAATPPGPETSNCIGLRCQRLGRRRNAREPVGEALGNDDGFGKPRTPDGRVLERALSARSSKSGKAYREVVKLIIGRRALDMMSRRGQRRSLMRRFRGGKQTIMRSDFAVVNSRQDVELKCSQWKPVGAHLISSHVCYLTATPRVASRRSSV